MKTKRNTITCNCNAYHFPHRWTGGKCKAQKPQQFTDKQNVEARNYANEYQNRFGAWDFDTLESIEAILNG